MQGECALYLASVPGTRDRIENVSFTAIIVWGRCRWGGGGVGGGLANDGFCPELHLDEDGYEGEQKTSLCE